MCLVVNPAAGQDGVVRDDTIDTELGGEQLFATPCAAASCLLRDLISSFTLPVNRVKLLQLGTLALHTVLNRSWQSALTSLLSCL